MNLEGWRTGCRPCGVGDDGRIGNLLEKTQCKGGDISHRKWTIYFPVADGRITTLGGDQELRTSTLVRDRPIRGESHVDFLGESEGSLPPPHDSFPDAGEAINDFESMSGNFINRHHVEPRVKLYSPRDELFPIPLKYIDVSRTTHTNLDVKQEKRIDDYWNIDGSRDLSDPWTGFTQITLLEEKPPDGHMWSGWRLTKRQLTSRPDHLWPELWINLGRNAKLKEKQKWSNEKPKLDNARRLRRILIYPEDKEFKLLFTNISDIFIAGTRNSYTASHTSKEWENERRSSRKLVTWTSRNRKKKKMTTKEYGESRCAICQSGLWSSRPRRIQFFSWITFRTASKSGFGQA